MGRALHGWDSIRIRRVAPGIRGLRRQHALGIGYHFSGIYDLHWLRYQPKPDPTGYQRILDHLGIKGHDALMIDDIAANLQPAHKLGIATILVGSRQQEAYGVDAVAADIYVALRIARGMLVSSHSSDASSHQEKRRD